MRRWALFEKRESRRVLNLTSVVLREGSFPLTDDFVIYGEGLLDHDAFIEFAQRFLARSFSQAPSKDRIVVYFRNGSGKRSRVADGNQEPIHAMRHHFSTTRRIRGYQRPRAGRRFNQAFGEPLAVAG